MSLLVEALFKALLILTPAGVAHYPSTATSATAIIEPAPVIAPLTVSTLEIIEP